MALFQQGRMAVNARLFEGLDWDAIKIRHFDGVTTWAYLDDGDP